MDRLLICETELGVDDGVSTANERVYSREYLR